MFQDWCLVKLMNTTKKSLLYNVFELFWVREKLLDKHISDCQNNKEVVIDFPNDPNLYFKNYHKKLKLQFVFYADFEYFTKTIHSC